MVLGMCCVLACEARAEFLISSAILEFTGDGPRQLDVELISRSQENDYIVTEVREVLRPGAADETIRQVEDPADSWLLVTPERTVLAAGSRKVMRFVLLKEPDESEHIYRVAMKPVVKDVENSAKLGLKILVGYEALVIIRPRTITPNFEVTREGRMLRVENRGTSNVLLQNGRQCDEGPDCRLPPVVRAYAGRTVTVELPYAREVRYSVWDGVTTHDMRY